MRTLLATTILMCVCLLSSCRTSDKAWQNINHPTGRNLGKQFAVPPSEYATWVIWGWEGPMTQEVIARDLDSFKLKGVKAVSIEAGYGMENAPYLSEGWFELIRYAAEQAKIRDMRIWLIDEGKYPSGFAGGKFSQERPDLRMQGLSVLERRTLKGGEKLVESVDPKAISAVAINRKDRISEIVPIKRGQIVWQVPAGEWELQLIQAGFKTSVTRAANNPSRGKDATNSLCDYLNPEATKQFLEFTHVQYKRYLGDLLGTTVLGFRGDEPDYGFTPWTPGIDSIFMAHKGYDVVPYLASFFSPVLTNEMQRAKADYWDIWSNLFSENFFGVQSEWCAANGVEYMVHLNHEENLAALTRSSGDFFRNMRYVQVPGVDAIWNQIFPDSINNFPKLASSAAHLFGQPKAFSETFAGYFTKPTPKQAKWILDYQFARGINTFELMFWSSSANGRSGATGWMADPEFPGIMHYLNRVGYVLSQGTSAARIGLYYPTSSMFLGNNISNDQTWEIVQNLLDNQRDFDFVDEQSLSSVMKLESGLFTNLSGQQYSCIIIPTSVTIPVIAYERLKLFASQGGKVIVMGEAPDNTYRRTFTLTRKDTNWDFAQTESCCEVTPSVLLGLPQPDLMLDQPAKRFTYVHRSLEDSEVYFLFNEGNEAVTRNITFKGTGTVQKWDALSATISDLTPVKTGEGTCTLTMTLEPWETVLLVIGEKLKEPK